MSILLNRNPFYISEMLEGYEMKNVSSLRGIDKVGLWQLQKSPKPQIDRIKVKTVKANHYHPPPPLWKHAVRHREICMQYSLKTYEIDFVTIVISTEISEISDILIWFYIYILSKSHPRIILIKETENQWISMNFNKISYPFLSEQPTDWPYNTAENLIFWPSFRF